MKKIILTIAFAIILGSAIQAQNEFKKLYELKFPVSVDTWINNDDQSLVVAGDLAELCGIDATQGKVLWQFVVKEKFGVKKLESWDYHTETGVVELTHKGDKKDDIKTIYLDERTGEILSEDASKRPKKERSYGSSAHVKLNKSSFVGRGGLHLEDPDITLRLSYERPKMNASFGRGKTMPITVSCSGEYNWSSTVNGAFVRALCDNVIGFGDDFGGDFIDIDTYGDYVFIQYEGLSVLDIKTGKLLWFSGR
jgi:hypothetical protein